MLTWSPGGRPWASISSPGFQAPVGPATKNAFLFSHPVVQTLVSTMGGPGAPVTHRVEGIRPALPREASGGQRARLFLTASGTRPTPPAALAPPVDALPQLQIPGRRLLSLWSRVRRQLPDGGPAQLVIARRWACLSSCPLPKTWPSAPRAQICPGSTLTPRAAGENSTYTAGGGGYLDGQLETETQVTSY